jgi:hypothetical protein
MKEAGGAGVSLYICVNKVSGKPRTLQRWEHVTKIIYEGKGVRYYKI